MESPRLVRNVVKYLGLLSGGHLSIVFRSRVLYLDAQENLVNVVHEVDRDVMKYKPYSRKMWHSCAFILELWSEK